MPAVLNGYGKMLKAALFTACLGLLLATQMLPSRALCLPEVKHSASEAWGGVSRTAAATTYPLELTSPLALSFTPSPPRVGGRVSASFRIKNITGSQVLIQRLKVRIRSGDLAQDISGFANVSLNPGAEYDFKAYRILDYQGDFQALVMAMIGGSWARIRNNLPVSFTVYRYGWKMENSGTGAKLNAVSVLDASKVWAVGESGTIIFYNGSGWIKQSSGTTNELLAVHALASDCVWAVGRNGTIRFFNGTSWTSKDCGLNIVLTGIFALSRSVVWVVGDGYEAGGYILKSTDGGNHWSVIFHHTNCYFTSVDVVNSNLLWFTGGDNFTFDHGSVFKSASGGTSIEIASDIYGCYENLDAVSDAAVWAVGYTYNSDGKNFIKKSEDGGKTWKNLLAWNAYSEPRTYPTAVKALNKASCWVVGYSGFIRFTIDGGRRWQRQTSPSQNNLLDVDACDYDHAWAVGEGGVVIRYTKL